LGATYAVLVDENKIASGEFAVKSSQSGEQTKIKRAELAQVLDV